MLVSLFLWGKIFKNLQGRASCDIMMIFKKVNVQDICSMEIIMINITEKDWRLFKEKLSCWQERHMARLNDEYLKFCQVTVLHQKSFGK